MAFPVLLDACVLAPMPLADFLLRLADEGIYRPLWSEDTLVETRHTMLEKLDIPPELADKRLNAMREHFIDAQVTGYRELIGSMRNNEKGRHVLTAAVRERAEVIVTADLRGFPTGVVEPYNIEVRHPDPFLLDQIDFYEDATRSVSSESWPPMRIRRSQHTSSSTLWAPELCRYPLRSTLFPDNGGRRTYAETHPSAHEN